MMTDQAHNSPEPPQTWKKRELRLYPELWHFHPADAAARQWIAPFRLGWVLQCIVGVTAGMAWFLVCNLVFIAVFDLSMQRFGHSSTSTALIVAWAAFVLMGTPFACVMGSRVIRLFKHAFLRRELRGRGVPICITCGYEGGDISAPRCPECGAPAAS